MKNIFLKNVTEPMQYKASSHPVSKKYPKRDVSAHASYLKGKLEKCAREATSPQQVAAIKYKNGTYIEFSGETGYELATKSLENRTQGIRLLNVREENETVKATVYVPEGKISYYLRKIEQYAGEPLATGHSRNEDLVNSIEDVELAVLESFWLDDKSKMPNDTATQCEIWLRYEEKSGKRKAKTNVAAKEEVEAAFDELCSNLNIRINGKSLYFPERIVKLITVNQTQLKQLLATFEYVAEFRKAEEPNDFFEELTVPEQREWVEDVLSRTAFAKSGVSVCILDAGINSSHPLLAPAIDEKCVQALEPQWGTADNDRHGGHGTEMAGVALFYDLKDALLDEGEAVIAHEIESVKILPPNGENPRALYGEKTQQAALMADIAKTSNNRVLCMAVTSNDNADNDGRPTSWSAAIDALTSGAAEEDVKRLFVVSAGNVELGEFQNQDYPTANRNHPVENPAQSWNAITAGAYCGKVQVSNPDFEGFSPVADLGQLSPYSATSAIWSPKWPIKPEVLFDGGNAVTNGSDFDSCPGLTLLTTGHRINMNLFSTIGGTSAATAQAAWFCAKLETEYPEMWPETVRALMIHSAEQTDKMKEQFCQDESKKRDRRSLLRTCGYGIPNLDKAIGCAKNSVNMVIQSELQPYNQKGMNEMHMHKIPWPKDVLRDLGTAQAKLKVTLSYYIEPSPGEVGWKDRYQYPSCGLRFEVNNSTQNYDEFRHSVNKLMRDDDNTESRSGFERWYYGKSRDVGSIHSDFMIENAVDLCNCNYIAVYPVGGWWKERTYLGKYNNKIRYSLIVTIATPEVEADLYTSITTQIQDAITIPVTVTQN